MAINDLLGMGKIKEEIMMDVSVMRANALKIRKKKTKFAAVLLVLMLTLFQLLYEHRGGGG